MDCQFADSCGNKSPENCKKCAAGDDQYINAHQNIDELPEADYYGA